MSKDELYEALQHWINNPLITPLNKIDSFNEAIESAKLEERKRIIDHLISKDRGRTHSAAMICFYCQMIDWLKEENK